MKRFGILAYGVAIASIVLLTARETIEPSAYLYERHASEMAALGAAGWFVATLGPLALSVSFWRLARRVEPQWMWHLLFLPCAIAIFQTGGSILFYAAGVPDADGIEGRTLMAAFGLLVFTLLVHAVALAVQAIEWISRKEKAR